ncbi:M23 family metallopeptidase [Geomonas sp. Red69]|uniref:M23 family metallopeptidase n=1 Tax=Geomonas diazotrophica TaxID=2843197 RepID=UPI001C104F5B|nr:M23 family metallopeptidase [Geomonas diazotrophica]MBU5635970.1 M23 family metallopeptidase [Geomonas diazotrophica]
MKTTAVTMMLILLLLLGLGVYYFLDTAGPAFALSRQSGPISSKLDVTLRLRDRSGLKSLNVNLVQGQKNFPILTREYPSGIKEGAETFRLPAQPGLKEGPVRLEVRAVDRSIFGFGSGNRSEQTFNFDYLNKPPAVAVLSTAHNVSRGGAGLVVYTVNREVAKTGVLFADRFYPAYRQPGGYYACLFPFPSDLLQERFIPKVLAVDRAGNERLTGIYYHVLEKSFPRDRIELTDSFLEKVSGEFKDRFPQAATPQELFLKVNREVRQADRKTLYQAGLKTSPTPLWQGGFLRLPNSAPRGTFSQLRSYFYKGKQVDEQYHLGIDLASLAHSKVPAANAGRVVWADDLGIYGQCVIIDHGLGLQSLYGHLSRIAVKEGDQVKKGDIIGDTGDTGLAGGDHLHFGVVVSGQEVNPIEWWDPSWIKNNITDKLEEAKQAGGAR